MLTHPDTYDALRKEIDDSSLNPDDSLDHEALSRLEYLNGVISESLRLGTPFFLPRIVPDGGAIVEHNHIPGGTVVALAAYSQQISGDNFFPESQVCRLNFLGYFTGHFHIAQLL